MDSKRNLYEESEKLRELQISFRANEILFSEDDRSFEMYILLSGKVEILKNNKRIALVEEKGTYLGELSTLLGISRTATVRTLSPCKFMVVSGEKVMDFFSNSPSLGLKLARMLADRLAKMNVEHVKLERRINLLSGRLREATEKLKNRDKQVQQLVTRIDQIRKL